MKLVIIVLLFLSNDGFFSPLQPKSTDCYQREVKLEKKKCVSACYQSLKMNCLQFFSSFEFKFAYIASLYCKGAVLRIQLVVFKSVYSFFFISSDVP
jgi:hypothetical protein